MCMIFNKIKIKKERNREIIITMTICIINKNYRNVKKVTDRPDCAADVVVKLSEMFLQVSPSQGNVESSPFIIPSVYGNVTISGGIKDQRNVSKTSAGFR